MRPGTLGFCSSSSSIRTVRMRCEAMLRKRALRCEAFRPSLRPAFLCRMVELPLADRAMMRQLHPQPQADRAEPLADFLQGRFAEIADLQQLIFALGHQVADRVDAFRLEAVGRTHR